MFKNVVNGNASESCITVGCGSTARKITSLQDTSSMVQCLVKQKGQIHLTFHGVITQKTTN